MGSPDRINMATPTRRKDWLVPPAALALLMTAALPAFAGFTNGGFEDGDFTGWTLSSYLNAAPGLTGNQPYTGASITYGVGGSTSLSVIITSPTESGYDPQLGSSATLRIPKYSTATARINSFMATSAYGHGKNANTLVQRVLMTAGDVDTDGLIHVRFIYAPVLQDPSHPPNEEPYFYVAVHNVSRSNALLYDALHYSAEPGVPWQIVPATGTVPETGPGTGPGPGMGPAPVSIYYTDWQIVDIAPGNSALAVGDLVEVQVTASGCEPGGHYSYIYLDTFGPVIPGLSVEAAADRTFVAPQGTINYTFTYRNGGATPVDNVTVTDVVPSSTTADAPLPSGCSLAVTGGTSTVTCALGKLEARAAGSFQLGVTLVPLAANATGYIYNGNYSIQGAGVGSTLGPLVTVPIQGPSADIALSQAVSSTQVYEGASLTYNLYVVNLGTSVAQNVVLVDNLPASLTLVSAAATQGVCTGVSRISCGLGNINALQTATVTIVAQAAQLGEIVSTASVSGSFTDLNPVNSSTAAVHCVPPPPAPASTAILTVTSGTIQVQWTAVNGATSYLLVASTVANNPTAVWASSGTALTTATLSGLLPSTTYYFFAAAYGAGNGFPTGYGLLGSTYINYLNSLTIVMSPEISSCVGPLLTPHGLIEACFPRGAFSSSFTVTLAGLSADLPEAPSHAAKLIPLGTDVGMELDVVPALQPLQPVEIWIGYLDTDLGSSQPRGSLVLAYYDPAPNVWVPVPSTSSLAGNMVTGQTLHLSKFQVMSTTPASDLSSPKVFPNPFRPALGRRWITFSQLPADTRIRVYTILGELVREFDTDATGMAHWDANNQSGQSVASGSYFALVQAKGKKTIMKVLIQR